MKRKIISLLLCLLMALSLIPTVAFGEGGDVNEKLGWKYAVISENADNGGYSIRTAQSNENLSEQVTVKIGNETLTQSADNASESPREISSNSTDNVTISVKTGYYIAYVVLCCNDGNGYGCKTSRGDNAFGMEGSVDGRTVTIPVASICKNIPHGFGDKVNFWLMVMVAPIPNPVYVGYESGSINGVPISAAPVIKDGGTDGGTWVADKFIKQYPTTPNTAAPTHNALAISSAAEAEANLKGYTFAGWQLTYYKAYTDGSFSGQTDAGVGGIKSAGDSITLFTNAKLVAQWKEAPQPTTGNLTITKDFEGLPENTRPESVTFTVTGPNNDSQPVTLTANNQWSTTLTDLPLGQYTVTETSAAIDGYTYTTTGTGEVEVTANGATVTVTNTYDELPTASETIDIPVEKVWSDGNENHENDSVTVKLLNGGEETGKTLTLNAANNWQGSFTAVPADGNYTVSEVAVDGYTADYTQPVITGLSVTGWGDKFEPASTSSYNITGSDLLVGNKGGTYFVWTLDSLTDTQKNDLMVAINNADLVGLGKSLTAKNTAFASGKEAEFNNGEVTISSNTITFSETNVWSLFYCGNLTLSSVTKATITNSKNIGETVNNTATLTITKVDADATTQKLTGAVFELTNGTTTLTSEDKNNGTYTISGINAEGTWTLTETTAPEGYQQTTQTWTITVTKESSETLTDGKFVTTNTYKISGVDNDALTAAMAEYPMEITNTKIPNTVVEIPVTKNVTISRGSKEPAATLFTFEAYVGDQKVGSLTLTPTKDDNWTATGMLEVSIPYDLFENGMATVTIKEVNDKVANWKYDTNEYTVSVNNDDVKPEIDAQAMSDQVQEPTALTFTNEYSYKYTPTPLPTPPRPVTSVKTGDMGVALYAVTSLLSLSGAAVIIKKRKDEE